MTQSQTPDHEPMFKHYTYNMAFAMIAFVENFAVYVCEPDGDDVRMWSLDEINDCQDHLFLITDESKKKKFGKHDQANL
jgi:hypothetical protein